MYFWGRKSVYLMIRLNLMKNSICCNFLFCGLFFIVALTVCEGRVWKRPFGKIEWSLYCHFSVIIVRHTCFQNSNGNEFNIIIICFLWTLKPFLFVEIIMLWTALFFLVLHYMLCVLLFTSKTRTSTEKGVFTFKICLSTHPSFISQRGTLLGLFKVKANSK